MRWTQTDKDRLQELAEALDDKLPVDGDVSVKRCRVAGCNAITIHDGDSLRIEIDSRRSPSDAKYDLCEEWAHCMAGFTGKEDSDHGAMWGIAYAACIQLLLKLKRERWQT